MSGPCDWPVSYMGCNSTQSLSSLSEEDKDRVERVAVEYLWRWTGQVFGKCPVVYRPCRTDAVRPSPWNELALLMGPARRGACGECGPDRCACVDGTRVLQLPGPVHSLEKVVVDGTDLPATAYFLEGSRLIRTDGGRWPVYQDLATAPGSAGTWEVYYVQGVEVPEGGQLAAGVLANEFAKLLCKDNTCELPKRITSITRQGVGVTLLDGFEGLETGKTGIWAIDSWVLSVIKPASRGARVYSVDVKPAGVRRRVL